MSADGGSQVLKGFERPGPEAQAIFRTLLTAMSEPGLVLPCPAVLRSAPLPGAMAAVALSLFDYETPVWLAGGLARPDVQTFLTFHTGAPLVVVPEKAAFVLAETPAESPALDLFDPGTPEFPDRSATILMGVASFEAGAKVFLKGPGIEDVRQFRAAGLDEAFWQSAAENASRFPLGVDFIFCGPDALAALPRSTRPSLANGGA